MNEKKLKFNFATLIFSVGGVIALGYLATYCVPVTDNAFVIENMTAISSTVGGHIEEIYVTNGQRLKAGEPILMIRQDRYKLEYEALKAQYDQGKVGLEVIQKKIAVSHADLKAAQDQLDRLKYEYGQKSDAKVSKAIPDLELKNLQYNIKSQANLVDSIKKRIELEQTEYKKAQVGLNTLKATSERASIDVDDTIVKAPFDGYVQNLYIGVGTSATPHIGLFNYVNTSETYIQANLNETDLAHVRSGDKVWIFPRAYFGHKVFHGVVMSDNWSVDRQHLVPLKQTQVVNTDNHWLNLPQRFPVQIKITDVDQNYPLRPGMSAYVYISTK